MEGRDLNQILSVECELEARLVEVEQMFIRSGKDRNVSESGFGKDNTVIKFMVRQKSLPD